MRIRIIVFLLVLFFAVGAQAQTFRWEKDDDAPKVERPRDDAFGSWFGVGIAKGVNAPYDWARRVPDRGFWGIPLAVPMVAWGVVAGTSQILWTVVALVRPGTAPLPWVRDHRYAMSISVTESCVFPGESINAGHGNRNISWSTQGDGRPCMNHETGEVYPNTADNPFPPHGLDVRWGKQPERVAGP